MTRVVERPPTRILFYRVGYDQRGDRRARSVEIVAKLYGDHTGTRAIASLRQLRQAGFRPPAPHQVPRPYGYSAARKALLQARAPGVVWADVLRHDPSSLAAASAEAASWLIRLQRCPTRTGFESQPGDLPAVARCAQELMSAFPRHASRLRPLTERLLSRLGSEGTALVPAHGDFHPENVFVAPGTITVIDFDRLGLREPAFDVGYALGQLLAMSYISLGDMAPGARAASDFWQRYEGEGEARWSRVAVHAARGMLQSLYWELCALPHSRTELLELWPELIEEWLRSDGPATLERFSGHRSE